VVISTIRLFPPRDQRRHLLAVLRSVQGPTQAQPRCKECRIYEEDGYDEAVLYFESWDSESDLERHVRSDLYQRVLAAIELSRTLPEIQFHYVSETKGIDLVQALRKGEAQGST
jgi:quinol monooxygenase YgiN